jgi:hypothetical protein
MRSRKIYGLLLVGTVLVYSCQKVISVNLNDASPQIVIEGNVYNTAGPYQVQITKTVNFDQDNTFPAVSGASVQITDQTSGTTDALTETTAGIYTTHTLQGVPGHTYQLNIVAQGQTYTALSTMPQPVPFDSLTFQHNNNFGNTSIFAVPNFQDPAGVPNYYLFNEYINNVRFTKIVYAIDDRLSDGKYISRQLYMDSAYISKGDNVRVDMNCIDKNVFNYFNTLDQAINGAGFETAAPTNPVSNISNNALGYFNAGTISSKTAIAK